MKLNFWKWIVKDKHFFSQLSELLRWKSTIFILMNKFEGKYVNVIIIIIVRSFYDCIHVIKLINWNNSFWITVLSCKHRHGKYILLFITIFWQLILFTIVWWISIFRISHYLQKTSRSLGKSTKDDHIRAVGYTSIKIINYLVSF